MTAMHRMGVLEREAGHILMELGYEPVIVSDRFPRPQFVPYNLIAMKKGSDGAADYLWVKLKVSLHPIRSPEEAAPFCRNETKFIEKLFRDTPDGKAPRYEVWFSVPSDKFECFEITRDGIKEAPHADRKTRQPDGGPA